MVDIVKPAAGATAKSPLRIQAFRNFWVNSVSFAFVQNALRFVFGWVVLDGLQRGEAWQGGVVFLFMIPMFFLLPAAGVWAERIDPRRLLIGTQAVFLVLIIGTALAVGDGAGTLPLMIIAALLTGVVAAIGSPVRTSMIPALLPKELLVGGIALNALGMTVSMVLGAVSAEFFGNRYGFDGAFWWLVALLAIGVAAAWRMESPGILNKGDTSSIRSSMSEAVRFVREDRGILTLFWLLGISGLLMAPIMFVTVQAHVKEALGRDASDAAPFFSLMGVGIAVSSLVIMRKGDMKNKSTVFMRAMLAGTTTIAVLGRTTEYWQLIALGAVMGLCAGVFINMNQALIQANTPAGVMGRVMALYVLVQAGLVPFGSLISGFLASWFGTGNTMTLLGVVAFALVVLTYVRATSIRTIN